MADISKVFENEKLLEKVATAETKYDAIKACKGEGLEVTDADLDAVAGGLKTVHKILIGVGAAAGTAAGAYGIYKLGDKKGWWYKRNKGPADNMHSIESIGESYEILDANHEVVVKSFEPGGMYANDLTPNPNS